ncbi:MAG: hypothetical protein EOM37_14760 [Proteobacteria bacterium]|nr:hypothetical protein [Pseudomonadota bacterium]
MSVEAMVSVRPERKGASGVTFFAMLWGLGGLLLATLYLRTDWQATLGLLMIKMAFCGALAWDRFARTKAAILPDFLTVYLFMQFVAKTITALGMFVSSNNRAAGLVGQYMIVHIRVRPEYQFDAEMVFLLATVVFTSAWIALEKRTIMAVWHEPVPRATWATYGLSITTYLLLKASGIGGSLGMTQELMRLFSTGAIAVLLGGHSRYALGRPGGWMPVLALLPLLPLALRSGMKGEVALVFLPILLTIVRRPTTARLWFIMGFVVFVVLFIFPFSHEWRQANWFAKKDVGIGTVAERVAGKWEQTGLIETAADSTAKWLSRGSSSAQGGLVMQIAERDGLIGPVLIEGLASIFVPRFLWPDKPVYAPGAWFTWYLGRAASPEEATSSTAMMLPTEWYWMFGWVGVVFGMAFLGWLYFRCWRFLVVRASTGLFPLVALFALLARSGGLEEIHAIYAISSPVILVAYVMIFDRLQRLFFSRLTKLKFQQRKILKR